MATLTKGKTFTNGETVTPQKLHELVDLGTVSGIVNADISASAAIADTKLAQITTANKVAQSAVTNLTTDLAGKAAASHTHDERYYTETEVNTLLAGKQAAGSYAPATGIPPGAITGTAVITTDSRLSDARTPTSHTHGNITNAGAIGATANLPVVTTTSGVLATIPAGFAGQVLTSNGGTSAPSFQTLAATSTNANNLTGGSAGTIPYQSAAGTTAMLAAGTSGQVLRSNGAAAPSWLPLAASATTDTTNAANISTGTLPLARIPTGTTNNTVCIGNDSRLSDARTPVDESVTTAKLDNSTKQMLVPTGAVMPFAMNSAPSGWLPADGAAQSRSTYAALFSVIGTLYGTGDGTTTFNLPDLRGYFVRGAGTNADGTAAGTFGARQADSVGPHTHSGTTGDDSPDHTHGYARTSFTNIRASGASGTGTSEYNTNTSGASTRHQHPFTTSSQTPAGTTETRPDNIAMLYCIKF